MSMKMKRSGIFRDGEVKNMAKVEAIMKMRHLY